MLEQLKNNETPTDDSLESSDEHELNQLCYKDFPSLERIKAALKLQTSNKKLDWTTCARIAMMVGTLNLYLNVDLSYTWREASALVAKAAGRHISYARQIRLWIYHYLHFNELPIPSYNTSGSSILDDDAFSAELQLYLISQSKDGYIRAHDIIDYVTSPPVKERYGAKVKDITLRTAQRWLHWLSWRYTWKKNGMYVDGHEREDVVEYRKQFVQRWKENYEKWFILYDDSNGSVLSHPTGFPVPEGERFRLVLVTHDESMFYGNDRRKLKWINPTEGMTTERKGEGQSIMVSDFLTPDCGRLTHAGEYILCLDHASTCLLNKIIEKRIFSSVLEKIAMDILQVMTCSHKLKRQ